MMTSPTWDPKGDARRALRISVDDGGPRALSNPRSLDNLLRDLLPDLPRESALIVAAAQLDVANKLTAQITSHVDPETAIRLAADALAQGRPFDPSACRWVVEEFALALGYHIGHDGTRSGGSGFPHRRHGPPPPPKPPSTGRLPPSPGQPSSPPGRRRLPPPPTVAPPFRHLVASAGLAA